jgi:hypothetical protein
MMHGKSNIKNVTGMLGVEQMTEMVKEGGKK